MTKSTIFLSTAIALLMLITLSGCDIVGDIFEAGIWVGIIVLVLIIALVFWLFNRIRRR